jgi:hypothetical protein
MTQMGIKVKIKVLKEEERSCTVIFVSDKK